MTDEKILATVKPDGEYWQPELETMPREQLRQLQVKKLKDTINVCLKSPFYKKRLGDLGITADSINSLDDLRKIPFTTKQDLRDNYPFGLQAAPQSEIVRIHASTGTTGNPTIVGYTRKDIGVWSECMSRCLSAYGVGRDDVFSVAYGYGLFTGGLGAHYGVENLGGTVIPTSTPMASAISSASVRGSRAVSSSSYSLSR